MYDWVVIVVAGMLSVVMFVLEQGQSVVVYGIAVVSGVVAVVFAHHFVVVVEGYATAAVVVIVEI